MPIFWFCILAVSALARRVEEEEKDKGHNKGDQEDENDWETSEETEQEPNQRQETSSLGRRRGMEYSQNWKSLRNKRRKVIRKLGKQKPNNWELQPKVGEVN